MSTTKRLWWGLALLLASTFSVLLLMGKEIHRVAPPMPDLVVSESGETLYTLDDLQTGRQVWQSMGDMQVGSIWGHGALIAPDWTADWLHREAIALLDIWTQRESGSDYAQLSRAEQLGFEARLQEHIRPNHYDAATATITVSNDRANAIRSIIGHYDSLFGTDPALAELREDYAIKDGSVDTSEHRRQMTGFFFWTAWAAVTQRDDGTKSLAASYTNNWPYEPLVGNVSTPGTFI
ncbi:MAG: hypothetical protein ACSHXK_06110 [Oceanococcus sp.]